MDLPREPGELPRTNMPGVNATPTIGVVHRVSSAGVWLTSTLFDVKQEWGPIPFSGMGTSVSPPQVGDTALVVFAIGADGAVGTPWVVGWRRG